ncbi:YesL family protein [Sediminibacillus massiliensis]|uniref:YesL family protein n=1 Tax=Sediminibacillus massiliensis TaxID=1926277 RepID=UPI0009884866|nr:DUF624 domain-containing protein [Sediminibacillus massiliensis]
MELNGIFGGFYKISAWITRFACLNILWFIFNIPVLFFAYNLLLAGSIGEMVLTGIILSILTPFIFFPATTAMFSVMRRWVMGDDMKLVSSYWKYFKEEYRKSVLGGMFFGTCWLILAIDFYFYGNTDHDGSGIFYAFFIALSFLLLVFNLHFFSIIVHAKTNLLQALKNAMMITFGSPILTLEVGALSFLFIYLSFHGMAFLLPFGMGAIISFFAFAAFLRFYSKIQERTAAK